MPGTAIVTGGAGFIGSHLVDALVEQGYRVAVIDDLSSGSAERVNREASLHELDIVDGEALMRLAGSLAPEVIFHLAAQASVTASVRHPERDLAVNVLGTLNVLQASAEARAPIVFTSTGGALYGDEAPRPTDETQLPQPLSPYGASKLAGEAYIKTWALAHDLPHVVCRLGNVYGPRQNPHGEAGVVAIFADHIHQGRSPTLYGHGTPTRDYVFVADVVRALTAASLSQTPNTYNVATGTEADVSSLWRQLSAHAGADVQPKLADLRPGELKHSCLSIERISRELGWSPRVGLAEGLAQTYDAFLREFEER